MSASRQNLTLSGSPEATLPAAGPTITLHMQGRDIQVRAWRFDVVGVSGHILPVFLLDTDIEGNDPWDRTLTDHLYGGDTYYRLCQETVSWPGRHSSAARTGLPSRKSAT